MHVKIIDSSDAGPSIRMNDISLPQDQKIFVTDMVETPSNCVFSMRSAIDDAMEIQLEHDQIQ